MWWWAVGLALAALAVAAAFSAYLKPEMLVAFEELMALCAALLR